MQRPNTTRQKKGNQSTTTENKNHKINNAPHPTKRQKPKRALHNKRRKVLTIHTQKEKEKDVEEGAATKTTQVAAVRAKGREKGETIIRKTH